jgi:hypothetical protein
MAERTSDPVVPVLDKRAAAVVLTLDTDTTERDVGNQLLLCPRLARRIAGLIKP